LLIRIILLVFLSYACSFPVQAATPERIISLAPSITEILYDLGLEKNIAAVTDYCDQPKQAKAKPKIGGYDSPSLEIIISRRPDLVIMTKEKNPGHIRERLNSLGIRTYVFEAQRLFELPSAMRKMGRYLDVAETAEKRAKTIEKALERFARNAKKQRKQYGVTKALFVIHPEPLMAAGQGTVINDAFVLLGLKNIADKSALQYPNLSIEEVIRLAPDVIFIGTGYMQTEPPQKLMSRLNMLDAVKKKRVYIVSEALYRLGPRVVFGIEEIAAHLYVNPGDEGVR